MKFVSRRYVLKRRAEAQDATRRRIVEAAIELHEALGPAGTTVTDIAARAGVGRPTVYRHFPDEPSLLRACSGRYWDDNPAPEPERWRDLGDPDQRLRTALLETYDYHRRTEPMISHVLPDVGDTPIMAPYHDHWRRAAEVVAAAWPSRDRRRRRLTAAIRHALDFTTWQSLIRRHGLDEAEAVDLMARFVHTCAPPPRQR